MAHPKRCLDCGKPLAEGCRRRRATGLFNRWPDAGQFRRRQVRPPLEPRDWAGNAPGPGRLTLLRGRTDGHRLLPGWPGNHHRRRSMVALARTNWLDPGDALARAGGHRPRGKPGSLIPQYEIQPEPETASVKVIVMVPQSILWSLIGTVWGVVFPVAFRNRPVPPSNHRAAPAIVCSSDQNT
jgi:hypothetical protein